MRNRTLKNILVRGPNWLGDAVMCEPTLRGLKQIAPESKISVLVKPSVASLFKGHPAIDHIVCYEDKGRHAGLTGKWTLAQELRNADFDYALLLQNAFEAAFLSFIAGIPRRYGYATDGRSLFLSDPVAIPDRRSHMHQVEYYWNLLRPMGLTGDPMAPELFLTQEEEGEMVRRLEQAGISKSDLVVGVNPGSTYGGAKRWLPERFAESTDRVSRRLSESEGKAVSVVILGAKGEEQLGREIAARLSTRSAVLSGMTTIRELMAALKRCSLLLTNDTGPMHIAAAFQVPVVAVFGPTDWRTTSPYGENHALVRQPVDCAPCLQRECPIDHRCMTKVSVDQVYEAATTLIEEPGLKGRGRAGQGEVSGTNLSSPAGAAPLEGVTVFLDRDGTLNYDPGYLKSPAEVKLLPGVPEGLTRLKTAGARLVVVTNQSGVGRGFFTLKDLELVHERLQGLLEQDGAVIDAIYFCPHHPDDGCRCRKPGRAMVDRAVADLHLDLQRSYLVGDHMRDMQLAKAVGARAILLTTEAVGAKALEMLQVEQAMPDKVAKSLVEAADWILEDAVKTMHSSVAVGERAGRGQDGGDA